MNKHFDIRRFWWLMKLEVAKSRKALLMVLGVIFGLLFFVSLLIEPMTEAIRVFRSHPSNFASSLLLGGFILSSLAFNDLGNPLKRYTWLTLPVSTLERFLCMWLLTSFVWIALFTLLYTGYTWIANAVGPLLYAHVTFPQFDPISQFPLRAMQYYFVLQSIFLVGAVHFRGYVFPKTILTLTVFSIFCGIIIYFLLRDLFAYEHECVGLECEILVKIQENNAWLFVQKLFWSCLAPLCWILTYLGLKEKEV